MTEEEKPIRVVDRRMFTPEGELRPGFEGEGDGEGEPKREGELRREGEPRVEEPLPSPPPPPQPSAGSRVKADAEPEAPPPGEETGLLEIIRSLGTTAYAALGLVPDPSGARRRDPMVARQMVDWLAVLEQKTRGNLTFEESDMLARVLYELRMAYVDVMRPPGGEPKR